MESKCSKCEKIKSTDEFYILKSGKPNSWCRPCVYENTKRYRAGEKTIRETKKVKIERITREKASKVDPFYINPEELFEAQLHDLIENKGY